MSTKNELAWDVEFDATKIAMERVMRALVVTSSHFTSSFTLAPVDKPTRGVSVFMRVWVPSGKEQRFLELAGLDELKPPPRVHVGMNTYPPGPARSSIKRTKPEESK